jgi:hypothetical protein
MAKKLDRSLAEDTFVCVNDETILLQKRKHLAQVAAMEGLAGAGDKNVGESKRQIAEQRVHEALEHHACVLQAEGHADELKQAERCDDSRLGDVGGGDGDLQIPLLEIQLTENRTAGEAGYQVRHVG